jgi:adenylate kinase family enzyme
MSTTSTSPGAQRILLLGSPGSGKSLLAERLAPRLGLPLVRMDDLYWREGWNRPTRERFLSELHQVLQREHWLMDGNYYETLAPRLERADTIVLLDLPTLVCLRGVLVRGFWRLMGQTSTLPQRIREAGGGQRRKPDLKFVRKVLTFQRDVRPELLGRLEAVRDTKRLLILRRRQHVERMVDEVCSVLGTSLNA